MQLRKLTAVITLAAGAALCGPETPVMGGGDHRDDETVDLADYAAFAGCMAGPEGGLGADCDVFDFDADGDVDFLDFADFQRVFGTTVTPPVVIETVHVGNPGNEGELSGRGAGGTGPDRICGAVDYSYNMGKFEVTAGQYCAFLNAVAASDPHYLYNTNMWSTGAGCKIERAGSPGSYTYSVAADWADRPVNYVSWGDAARFANWLHNGQPTGDQDLTTTEDGSYFLDGAMDDGELLAITRELDATWAIPSEDEWYKAAYHYNDGVTGNYFDYPTSSDIVPSNDLVEPDPGNNATFCFVDYTIGPPYWRTEVGAHENSESPYGTLDQGGNVREWNEAIFDSGYRGMRGGTFFHPVSSLHAATRGDNYGGPAFETFHIGFRVAEVPEPAR